MWYFNQFFKTINHILYYEIKLIIKINLRVAQIKNLLRKKQVTREVLQIEIGKSRSFSKLKTEWK